MNCIVAGIGNHGAKCQAQREEDLCRCIEPYKWVQKTFPLLMTNLKQTSAFRELLNLLFERHVSSGLEAQRALPSRYSYSYDAGADLDSLDPSSVDKYHARGLESNFWGHGNQTEQIMRTPCANRLLTCVVSSQRLLGTSNH